MKAAKIFLALIFMMALSFGANAQTKFEYATVIYAQLSMSKANVSISANGKFTQTELKIAEGSPQQNLNALLEIINKMSDEGWEVYSSNSEPGGVHYFLRKKKA